MPLSVLGYFNGLKSYLDSKFRVTTSSNSSELVLSEDIYTESGEVTQEVKLYFSGDCFAIKLDTREERKSKKGRFSNRTKREAIDIPLFNFFNNEGKPWSKRCDFVVFQYHQNRIKVYCIEFKYKTLPVEKIILQIKASVAWCKSLSSTIKSYTHETRRFNLTKYVFSCHPSPAAYLDREGKYLNRDHTIRHYLYDDVDGMNLEELENTNVEEIK